jgi:tetratricopeptide (TPR) repeat protein
MEELTYFFSYARDDSEVVLKLATELRAVGARLWLDQLDILAGQRWDRAVEDALVTCQGMIAVLSPASVVSQNVMDEVSYALEEGKLVVPILLRPCAIPFRLRRVQYVDLTANYETGFSHLLRALRLDQPLHPLRPAAPQEPLVREVEGVSRPAVESERGEEQRQRQMAALYSEAQAATAAGDWAVAIEKWRDILALNPTHADASAKLREAQRQLELAALFTTGQQHYKAGHWREALDYYRKAADQGHAEAQFSLGWMYDDGRGVGKDEAMAVEWYRRAADQGLARAKDALRWWNRLKRWGSSL